MNFDVRFVFLDGGAWISWILKANMDFDVEVGLFFSNFFTLFELSSDGHNPYLLPPHTYTYTYTFSYKPYCEFPSTLLVSAVPLQYPLPVLMHSFEAVKNGSILWTN